MNLIQKIFSVKNNSDKTRKIVRFLGLKISFKIFKKPYIEKNTFILWEPTIKYHGEVILGFAKYLIELGYNVSVIMDLNHLNDGLFARFSNKKLHLNDITLDETKKYFKKFGLNKKVQGLMITSSRNAADDKTTYDEYKNLFSDKDLNRVFFVEHEVAPPIDKNFWKEDIITLAPIDYKNKSSVVVNPNYFGEFKKHFKNETVNFIVVGALETQRKNFNLLFEAVKENNDKNFKVTIIGNGDYSYIPSEIVHHFEIMGRLLFKDMYNCIEKSDYILALLDKNNKKHYRYITTGTSGTYQLCYGFLKPLIIDETFCKNRFLNSNNAILYSDNNLSKAIDYAIKQTKTDYDIMVLDLQKTTLKIRHNSKDNLEKLIKSRK